MIAQTQTKPKNFQLYKAHADTGANYGAGKLVKLREKNKSEVIAFLAERSIHTVVMSSFIADNGIENPNNRGKFYGYRDNRGNLQGVALIGHTTLIEARSENAVFRFAQIARKSETPIHFMMSDGDTIETFWENFIGEPIKPRLVCTERLFEISKSAPLPKTTANLRLATEAELVPVAEAHAEVALLESGTNPMERDREGFLRRTLARIQKGRTWIVFENDELLFKADIVAENADVVYLEGIYVNPKRRGQSLAAKCLSHLSGVLLEKVKHVCLLSNVEFEQAHRAYQKAGFSMRETYQTIFV